MSAPYIRKPAVAGSWYPDDTGRLTAFMSEHLPPVETPAAKPRAIVVPHAGYIYSGRTAATAFRCLEGHQWKRVIIMGPTHHVPFRGISAAPHDLFSTPLGDSPLDKEACEYLGRGGGEYYSLRDDVHEPEWSIEAELPFLQYVADEVPIVPIVCGQITLEYLREISSRMLPIWDDDTLLIISTDFTHYGWHFDYHPFSVEDAPRKLPELDGGAIDMIKAGDMEGFLGYIERTGATICGRFPVALMLGMMELQGRQSQVDLLDYRTSGEVTEDYTSTVSYAAITIT